nr:hypothetical protein [Tanacetum cinerariifolium]
MLSLFFLLLFLISNSSAVVSKMEKIITMIIKESKELPRELVNLLAMNGKIKNEIASPVGVQLAKKVLKSYADQLNPDNLEPDMTVNPESEKKTLAVVKMPSKSVTTKNGKCKRQWFDEISSYYPYEKNIVEKAIVDEVQDIFLFFQEENEGQSSRNFMFDDVNVEQIERRPTRDKRQPSYLDDYELDVKNAFLYGELDRDVFMKQPTGYVSKEHPYYVCRLKKALYGLKQAPRAWYDKVAQYLNFYGFMVSDADSSLFIKLESKIHLLVLLYIDDMIITEDNEAEISMLKDDLSVHFEIKYLGEAGYFLDKSTEIKTFMEPNLKLKKNEGTLLKDAKKYRQLVGSLIYLTMTRQELSYCVGKVSQFMQCPRTSHLEASKMILQYVKDDRHFTIGYCFSTGSVMVSWCSKKQLVVILSSTMAEYVGIDGDIVANVYAPQNPIEKKKLWDNLKIIRRNTQGHWLCFGDYNAIWDESDGKGILLELLEMKKMSKLDRIVISHDVFEFWPKIHVTTLPRRMLKESLEYEKSNLVKQLEDLDDKVDYGLLSESGLNRKK